MRKRDMVQKPTRNSAEASGRPTGVRPWVIGAGAVALLALWLPLIYLLGAQWSIYEQYNYGWAVPFLCAFLFWKRWSAGAPASVQSSEFKIQGSKFPGSAPSSGFNFCFLLSALCFVLLLALLPTRILQEANPLWRLASYALTAEVIVITLALIFFHGGTKALRHFAFPVVFFLVAVPWPTPVEGAVISSLTRLNTAAVVEVMHLLGIPALAQGNVIEVSTGRVGVEEACSGIRSTQAVLMLSLFFGEFFRLVWKRRLTLVIAGLGVAVVLNILRTSILVMLAAQGGIALSDRWHDVTGLSVLLLCFTLVWAMATGFARKPLPSFQPSDPRVERGSVEPSPLQSSEFKVPSSEWVSPSGWRRNRLPALAPQLSALVLIFSLLSVVGSELWFRAREGRHTDHQDFTIVLPKERTGFMETPQTEGVRAALRFDREACAKWKNPDGTVWQFFYFRWNPATRLKDRVRVQLAKSHRPEACLPAGGWKLATEFTRVIIQLDRTPLSFRTYEFKAGGQSVFVFFCVQEDGTKLGEAANMRQSHAVRWQAAWAGNRGLGQRSIEIAILGPRNAAHAEELLRAELPKLISAKAETLKN